MGVAVGIVAKSIWASQKARSEGGGSSRGRPPGSVHMTRTEWGTLWGARLCAGAFAMPVVGRGW